ncbi:MAG: hypothetical protein ABSG03_23285 [Bryobacteraceae bacterium]
MGERVAEGCQALERSLPGVMCPNRAWWKDALTNSLEVDAVAAYGILQFRGMEGGDPVAARL